MTWLLLIACSGKDADTYAPTPDTDEVDFDPDADEGVDEEGEGDDTGEPLDDSDDPFPDDTGGTDTVDSGLPVDDTGDPLIEPTPYAGCEGVETWDFGLDGADDIYYRWYDENGDLTDYEKDDDADGDIDVIRAYTYTAGEETGAWYDEDGDGWWDYAIYTSYDADGLPLSQVLDVDADTVEDQRYDYVNVDGKVQEAWYDQDGDGFVDVYYFYTYKDDKLQSIEGDRGGDGTVDALYTYTWSVTPEGYDAQFEQSDRDEDGVIDHEDYSVYDLEGRLVEFWIDEDASGIPESSTTWTYRLDNQLATQSGDVYTKEVLYYSYTGTFSYDFDDRVELEDWVFVAGGGESLAESVHAWSCLP